MRAQVARLPALRREEALRGVAWPSPIVRSGCGTAALGPRYAYLLGGGVALGAFGSPVGALVGALVGVACTARRFSLDRARQTLTLIYPCIAPTAAPEQLLTAVASSTKHSNNCEHPSAAMSYQDYNYDLFAEEDGDDVLPPYQAINPAHLVLDSTNVTGTTTICAHLLIASLLCSIRSTQSTLSLDFVTY